jgi:hypothetical protein
MPASRPTTDVRIRRLYWLALMGAVILMAGVLLFCHAELRGAQYINRMHAILDDIDIELDGTPARQAAFEEAFFTAQQREKMDESWNSFSRERWWGYRVIAPVGAGVLAGSLVILAAATGCRFGLRALLAVMLYVALVIGIPLGVVRPRLHDPRVSMQWGPGIDYIFLRYYQGSTRRGGGPRWSFALVDWRNLLLAAGAGVIPPAIALLRAPRSKLNSSTAEPETMTTFDPGR